MISLIQRKQPAKSAARSTQIESSCTKAPSEAAPPEVLEAFALLADDSHMSRWYHRISIQLIDDTLVIDGSLPSFYLKQILQERLRPMGRRLVNQVNVTLR